MPKIKDKGTHYEVTPDLAETIGQMILGITQGFQRKREKKEQDEKEAQRISEEQSKFAAQLATIAQEDPEYANMLQALPHVQEFMNPAKADRARHAGEGPLQKLFHRGEHGAMDKARFKPNEFQVSPALQAKREKARADADTAQLNEDLAAERNKRLLNSAGDYDAVINDMLIKGIPVNPQNIAARLSKGDTALAAENLNIPYTKEWIGKHAATAAGDMFKERPDADPKDIMLAAQSMFDPDVVLDEGTRKRLGTSKTGKQFNLDERGLELRGKELKLQTDRFKLESTVKKGELAQFFVDNGVEPNQALSQATKFLETGKLDMTLPADKKEEADRLYTEAQTADLRLKTEQARQRSPKFDQAVTMASTSKDTEEKEKWLKIAEAEFYRLHPLAKKSPLSFREHIIQGLAQFAGRHPVAGVNAAIGVKAAGATVGAANDALKGAARLMAIPDLDASGIMSPRPRGIPSPAGAVDIKQVYGPETERLVDTYADALLAAMNNPGVTPEERKQLGAHAKMLQDALMNRDITTIMSLIQGGQGGGTQR